MLDTERLSPDPGPYSNDPPLWKILPLRYLRRRARNPLQVPHRRLKHGPLPPQRKAHRFLQGRLVCGQRRCVRDH